MKTIPVKEFVSNVFDLWDRKWFLLTSGDFEKKDFNTMTVAWGSFGIMWNKPMAIVVVRPGRHTYQFTEKYDTFTLTTFPEKYRDALNLLGTKSGRDGDKIAEAGLRVCASKKIAAPAFTEAELVIECRKAYWDDYKPEHFLNRDIDKSYPKKDYHRIYYGEIVNISGTEEYQD